MEIELLKKALSSKITPAVKYGGQTKLAAVLIVIYGKEPMIIMTERPKTMNYHAGEISFPGGTWIQRDDNLLTTALRETKEEMNLHISRQQIIGQIRPVTTLNSGFTITPFICILDEVPKLIPNSEIETILHIPFVPLLNTIEDDLDPLHKSIQEMYTFRYQHHLIWGASARMLKQMFNILSETGLL
ncbi:MAG TPA: CoA pyrophosphatase [Nitrosopumilaceae archaeon]|nr:CoA pyrophosphatase [Nitrosopumilaceae archaeon]